MLGRLLDKAIAELAPGWATRRFVARERLKMLATYAAADKGRRNKDWRNADGRSADQANIPDAQTLNGRSRQMVRDSWVAKSAVLSAARNVTGRGIVPVPVIKDDAGKDDRALNAAVEALFLRWASRPASCDVERRQTFWAKQGLCVSERFTVGEHFLVWSYRPDPRMVGLRLQSFEPEQLDPVTQSYTDPATGETNQVRGGVEVDLDGAAVAYHFYTRNPNDYLGVAQLVPIRVPAYRVLHYFKQERTLQTRGVTPLAPVLQRMRDFHRVDDAEMWAKIMEACIGLVITRDIPTGLGKSPTLNAETGDPGQTASGLRTADMVPGMIFEAAPGEKVEGFSPTRPGGTYEPFSRGTLRGIGAGIGNSYEQLARDFSQGTYSSQRQGMLEERKEWEIEQDLLIDLIIMPVVELWMTFAVLEGRFEAQGLTADAFMADQTRYQEHEYIAPAQPWIDPEKEANAYEKALELRIVTRKEIMAEQGRRLRRTFEQIRDEADQAEELGLSLPENAEDSTRTFKQDVIKAFIADGTVADVIANQTDLKALVKESGLSVNAEYVDPYLPVQDASGRTVTGALVTDGEGDVVGAEVDATSLPAPSPGQPNADAAGKDKIKAGAGGGDQKQEGGGSPGGAATQPANQAKPPGSKPMAAGADAAAAAADSADVIEGEGQGRPSLPAIPPITDASASPATGKRRRLRQAPQRPDGEPSIDVQSARDEV